MLGVSSCTPAFQFKMQLGSVWIAYGIVEADAGKVELDIGMLDLLVC